ncbi:MAG: hypothetical protein HQ501_04520, partial [Rhodospirillales bacterium]|nr:hypothetical protein [Rhodospirillales bacterium]
SDLGIKDFPSFQEADAFAEANVREMSESRAKERGASETDTVLTRDDIRVEIVGGGHVFVESKLTATSRGRPDLGT